jgi:hypothetical protein
VNGLRLRTVNGMRIALLADKSTPCDGDTLISEEDTVAILHYRGTSWDGQPSSPARRSRVAAQGGNPTPAVSGTMFVAPDTFMAAAPAGAPLPFASPTTLAERLRTVNVTSPKPVPRPRAKRTRMRSTVERWLREGRKVRCDTWGPATYVHGKDMDRLMDERGLRFALSSIYCTGTVWTVVP